MLLGSHPYACNLAPHLASLPHFLTVLGRGPTMAARSEVLGARPIGGEKPLRVPSGLESLHAPLPLAGRLVGALGAVIQIAMLAMFHPWEDLPLGRAVALQLSLSRLWYTGPPMEGGTTYGQYTIRRCTGAPHRVPGFNQFDPRRVSGAGPAF